MCSFVVVHQASEIFGKESLFVYLNEPPSTQLIVIHVIDECLNLMFCPVVKEIERGIFLITCKVEKYFQNRN